MVTISSTPQVTAAPRAIAQAPVQRTAAVYPSDSLQLSTRTAPPVVRTAALSPVQKIALLAAPVVAGAGIGLAVGGPIGALVGAGAGALVSVVGLWWAITDKPWGGKPGTQDPPPPLPPQP